VPISLILADGYAMVRQGLAGLLRAEPDIAVTAEAADGETAWGLITTYRPQVAILDFDLPQANGIEVARRVMDAALDTRVLLLAMRDAPAAALAAREAGVLGFVLKDSPFEELALAVRAIAAGQTYVTPAVRAQLRTIQRAGNLTVALSARERQVVRLIADGSSSKEIARLLGISPGTVNTHRKRLMKKLGVRTATAVVRWGVQGGWSCDRSAVLPSSAFSVSPVLGTALYTGGGTPAVTPFAYNFFGSLSGISSRTRGCGSRTKSKRWQVFFPMTASSGGCRRPMEISGDKGADLLHFLVNSKT